jgi:hypothetical protein
MPSAKLIPPRCRECQHRVHLCRDCKLRLQRHRSKHAHLLPRAYRRPAAALCGMLRHGLPTGACMDGMAMLLQALHLDASSSDAVTLQEPESAHVPSAPLVPAVPVWRSVLPSGSRRKRCPLAACCYQLFQPHNKCFAHPGDHDWQELPEADNVGSAPNSSREPTPALRDPTTDRNRSIGVHAPMKRSQRAKRF